MLLAVCSIRCVLFVCLLISFDSCEWVARVASLWVIYYGLLTNHIWLTHLLKYDWLQMLLPLNLEWPIAVGEMFSSWCFAWRVFTIFVSTQVSHFHNCLNKSLMCIKYQVFVFFTICHLYCYHFAGWELLGGLGLNPTLLIRKMITSTDAWHSSLKSEIFPASFDPQPHS